MSAVTQGFLFFIHIWTGEGEHVFNEVMFSELRMSAISVGCQQLAF
jgi:hypothetical protein